MRFKYFGLLAIGLLAALPVLADFDPVSPAEPGVPVVIPPAEREYNFSAVCAPVSGGSLNIYEKICKGGTSISLRATSATGFRFAGWEEDGEVVSTDASFSYVMPMRDVSLTARFIFDPGSPAEPSQPVVVIKPKQGKIFLTADPNAGGYFNVNSGSAYDVNTSVSLRATSNAGFVFTGWTEDDERISDTASFDYTVTEGDHILVAHFKFDPTSPSEPAVPVIYRTLTLKKNMAGGTLKGGGTVAVGQSVAVSTTLNNDYYFENWTDPSGEVVSDEMSFDFIMPSYDVTLTANYRYEAPPFDPTSPAEPGVPQPGGSVEIAPDQVIGPRFTMVDIDHVAILCETDATTIRYALGDEIPSETSGTLYEEPVYVPQNIMIRACAFKEGMRTSPVRAYYVDSHRVVTPNIVCRKHKLEIDCDTPNALVTYTTDWSIPTRDSQVYDGTPLELPEDTRLSAVGFKTGLADSEVAVFPWRIAYVTLSAPKFRITDYGLLEMSQVEGAPIYYTLDGSDPSNPDSSPLCYSDPIKVSQSTIVTAVASDGDWFDSALATFTASGYMLPNPLVSVTDGKLQITCSEPNVTLYYTLDGSDPSKEAYEKTLSGTNADGQQCFLYEEPVEVQNVRSIKAIACKTGYFNSEITELISSRVALSVKEVGLSLVATAEPAVAQIFYRVDDSAEEIRYTDPIYPTSSANYTFVGRCGGYLDSEPVSIYFDAQLHTLPEFGIEIHDQYLHIILTSLEQTAFFTLDGSDPTLDPEVNPSVYVYDSYNLISLEGWPNETCEVRAVVRQADMFDSPVASRIFHKLPTPELELKGLRVYPHFEEKEWFDENDIPGWFVQIDDEFVYNANDLEDGCIKLEQKDYNFKARVMGNQYIWSDVVELNFVAADHTVSQPVCFPKFDERKIWLGAEYTDGVELQFTISDSDGNLLQDFATNYEGILDQGNVPVEYISIEADESMKYIQTQAVDKLGERFPSDIITQELNFCEAPVIEYNGVELAFISRDGNFIEMDGEFTNDGLLVFLPELTTYEATAWHPEKFRSRPIDVKIDFNFIPADNRLRVGDPGMVEYAFNYIGLEGLNTLAIEGEIDASDLGFLSRECRELESLSLTDCRFPEGFPALSEMRLTSGEVDLNCLHTLRVGDTAAEGSDWLTALPNLAEVYWDSQLPMARNLIRQLDPYVLKRSADGVEDGASDVNVIANDGCETLWVEVGHPFWSSEPFNALRAVAHLNVNQLTPDPKSDGSAGWYSIMLPFDCDGMVDAEKSVGYYPFLSTDQAADDHYRYWLKSADRGAKWRDEAMLIAGVPYIIAFPNNTHYPDEVCVAGYVHFIGENVTIRETSYHLSSPVETAWESGMMFAGSWLRGDGESHSGTLLGLNIEQIHTDDEGNNYAPGSVFADRYDVVPLSGYVVDPSGSSRIMRIGGESSDLALPQVSDNFVVEPCGRQFRISASADVEVEVVSATGLRLASYRLMPGEVAETDALLPGVYIIGNRKFILR